MGTNTPNYQLFKPNPDTDNVNVVTDLNNNYDKIDTELKLVSDSVIPILSVRKTADESVVSSVTLQTDDDLFKAVVANTKYMLDCFFIYSGAAAGTGGFKCDWTVPVGATLDWASYGVLGHSSGTLTDYDVPLLAASTTRSHGTNGVGNEMTLQPRGLLTVSGTAGTLALRWAQATSSATATILHTNSYFRLIKL